MAKVTGRTFLYFLTGKSITYTLKNWLTCRRWWCQLLSNPPFALQSYPSPRHRPAPAPWGWSWAAPLAPWLQTTRQFPSFTGWDREDKRIVLNIWLSALCLNGSTDAEPGPHSDIIWHEQLWRQLCSLCWHQRHMTQGSQEWNHCLNK